MKNPIQIKKVSAEVERKILIGMIVSDSFLKSIIPIFHSELVSEYSKIIARWCIDYFEKYGKAPNKVIQDIYFKNLKNKRIDPDRMELIEKFLSGLSTEYENSDKFNTEYALDQALEYFKKKSLQKLSDDLKLLTDNDDLSQASEIVNNYNNVCVTYQKYCDPFAEEDYKTIKIFEEGYKPLFVYSGAIGEMLNSLLTRDSFVSLMGPEKRSKSWWIMDMCIKANLQRNNVVLFQAGDMSEDQMKRRIFTSTTGKNYREKYCGRVKIPILDCVYNQDDSCKLKERTCNFGVLLEEGKTIPFEEVPEYIPCSVCRGKEGKKWKGAHWYKFSNISQLTPETVIKNKKKMLSIRKGKEFRISTHPNNTLSVKNIRAILDDWEIFGGFVPDVIAIDYADILAPETKRDTRDQINETWKSLRSLSQERHCLVVTATQSDADSYEKESLTMKNFSEDKRKLSHVTAMIALNQTPEEKDNRIMRLGNVAIRDESFSVTEQVVVLQCLEKGRPFLGSYWTKKEMKKKNDGRKKKYKNGD